MYFRMLWSESCSPCFLRSRVRLVGRPRPARSRRRCRPHPARLSRRQPAERSGGCWSSALSSPGRFGRRFLVLQTPSRKIIQHHPNRQKHLETLRTHSRSFTPPWEASGGQCCPEAPCAPSAGHDADEEAALRGTAGPGAAVFIVSISFFNVGRWSDGSKVSDL